MPPSKTNIAPSEFRLSDYIHTWFQLHIVKGSLDVKLPTSGQMQQEGSEKRERESQQKED